MNKLKIAFNVSCLKDERTRGFSRYTTRLIKYLQNHHVEVFLFSYGKVSTNHLKEINYKHLDENEDLNYLVWEQYYLPRQLKKHHIDVYHAPANYGIPIFFNGIKVVTIHDIIDFKLGQKLSFKFRFLSWVARKFSSKIITVSHYSKNDLISFFNINKKKVHVTYEASDLPKKSMTDAPIEKKKYFFYLGGWEARKNIPFLLQAFKESNLSHYKLILAGEKDLKRRQEISDFIKTNNIQNTELLDWIEDSDLINLYSEARAFIYPSLYEGFGLQLCEAMNYDVPIICSDRTSLPEILNNKEALFSPDDLTSLKDKLIQIAESDDFYTKLCKHSKNRKEFFSWEKMAKETFDIYQMKKGSLD